MTFINNTDKTAAAFHRMSNFVVYRHILQYMWILTTAQSQFWLGLVLMLVFGITVTDGCKNSQLATVMLRCNNSDGL